MPSPNSPVPRRRRVEGSGVGEPGPVLLEPIRRSALPTVLLLIKNVTVDIPTPLLLPNADATMPVIEVQLTLKVSAS